MSFFTTSVDPAQYADPRLAEAVSLLRETQAWLSPQAHIEIHHEHRFWEWGKGLAAAKAGLGRWPRTALDVGAGFGLLGPTLALLGTVVSESEIDGRALTTRQDQVNGPLGTRGAHPIIGVQGGFGSLPDASYELVCSISVIEHLPPDLEQVAWTDMAAKVAPNGVLYATIDVMDDNTYARGTDSLHVTKFTMDMLRERAERLERLGFSYLIDPPDWTYRGTFVLDYSFASLAMVKRP